MDRCCDFSCFGRCICFVCVHIMVSIHPSSQQSLILHNNRPRYTIDVISINFKILSKQSSSDASYILFQDHTFKLAHGSPVTMQFTTPMLVYMVDAQWSILLLYSSNRESCLLLSMSFTCLSLQVA